MNKHIRVWGGIAGLSLIFSLFGPLAASAAPPGTAPTLGAASTYAVFGKAGVTNDSNVGTTHIWGNVGADATNVTNLNDATQVDGVIDAGTGVEAATLSAYGQLAGQGPGTSLNLAGTNTVTPGIYDVAASTLNGTLTLNGAGVYIFQSTSSVAVGSGAQMILQNGASACNVFWQIPAAMTIGTGAHMEGTIIANTQLISLATGATLKGRALSRIAQVTMDSNQITEPTCAPPPGGGGGPNTGTITVVKHVINDNGRTKTVADFPLFVNGTPITSGASQDFPAPADAYTVTETSDPNYTRTFSGDCDLSGRLTLAPGENKVCIVTNDDIGAPVVVPPVPPLIDVVKVPSPLSLPSGPGAVTYTYTLRNIGTVPVTNITMVGDTCSPITLQSGDLNNDAKLQVNETWVYTCSTTLSQTHTNTVTATGWANGLSTSDIASATVVVGAPVVPPLIHVTKVPSPLTLPVGGGMVTYTEKVTNPGTVALSNVTLTDNTCAPMQRISGDTNGDGKLDVSETWTYTCRTNLAKTTSNTAVATGQANGFTVRDFAIATVVVAAAAPALPKTGVAPAGFPAWGAIAAGLLAAWLILYAIRKKGSAVRK